MVNLTFRIITIISIRIRNSRAKGKKNTIISRRIRLRDMLIRFFYLCIHLHKMLVPLALSLTKESLQYI